MQDLGDTICALSTARGKAGIAVVRVSGRDAYSILQTLFQRNSGDAELPPRRAVLGWIRERLTGRVLDEALVTCFPGPHSYTGEDVAEIAVHGSPAVVSAILDSLCAAGARLAEPGEFTMRAFLSGRMDLTQAEAVHDLIEAKTLYQVQVANRQRSGELTRALADTKKRLVDAIVQLESALEFVEEDLPLDSRDNIGAELQALERRLAAMGDSYRQGRIVRDGFNLTVIGRPNVGKSSIFNALLDQERSIVTEIAGTTRDPISEFTNFDGVPVRLLDTAGVRTSADPVEQIGVDRSYRAIADSDAVLLVVDASEPLQPEDTELRRHIDGASCIVAMNKSDLPCFWSEAVKTEYSGELGWVDVSAKTGAGLDALRQAILEKIFGRSGLDRDGILITSLRQCHCLEAAQERLRKAAAGVGEGFSEELILVDLHAALQLLGALTGETGVEDILGEIFSRFCVGK
jgi:tRNA modification GTPase